jgi:hypothetical protein
VQFQLLPPLLLLLPPLLLLLLVLLLIVEATVGPWHCCWCSYLAVGQVAAAETAAGWICC